MPDSVLNSLDTGGELMHIGTESTYFGNRTESALKAFQKAKGLNPTGYFGSETRNIMNGR